MRDLAFYVACVVAAVGCVLLVVGSWFGWTLAFLGTFALVALD